LLYLLTRQEVALMNRLKPYLVVISLLSSLASSQSWAEETKFVTAEGVAAVQQGAIDIARDAAVEDAQKKAIEQAIGIYIDSQTQVENFQLLSDNILSQVKGYIKRYNIIDERTDSGLLRVKINAEVSLGKLSDDLSAIGILMARMHKPRTMALIAEQNVGSGMRSWWTEPRGQETEIGVVENVFMDKFTEKGFEFVDHQAAAREIKVTPAYRTPDLSTVQAKALANQADAEVVIVGKALAKYYGDVGGGMKSVQADISARAVRTDTGQVLASVTTHAAAVHITETTAGVEALRKAANQAAEEMLAKILAVYSRETGSTRPVTIIITGLSKAQFAKFKDVLLNQVRGIKNLYERSFSGATAKIQVDSKSSAQILSDELSLKDFGTFSVEVVSSTANSLELKVVPKLK
jgi:hypothetical protein